MHHLSGKKKLPHGLLDLLPQRVVLACQINLGLNINCHDLARQGRKGRLEGEQGGFGDEDIYPELIKGIGSVTSQ